MSRSVEFEISDEEAAALEQLKADQDLSTKALYRQALMLYQLHHHRLKSGETCTWSGDVKRLQEFTGIAPNQDEIVEKLARKIYCAEEEMDEESNKAHIDFWFGPDPGEDYDPRGNWSGDTAEACRRAAKAALMFTNNMT